MRDLIKRFSKDPIIFAVIIFGGIISISVLWYFAIYESLSEEYQTSYQSREQLSKEVQNIRRLENELGALQKDWDNVNDEFEMVIETIPDKRLYDSVTDFLYSLIINHGLKIRNFSPSNVAIEKKKILIPDTGDEVTVEKIPIDITLRGSFIDLGQLMESMLKGKYRFTASNIEVTQINKTSSQSIKFISYAYFRSGMVYKTLKKNKVAVFNKSTSKLEPAKIDGKDNELGEVKSDAGTKVKQVDSIEGVPEMWLEPATEPVEGVEIAFLDKEVDSKQKETPKKVIEDVSKKKTQKPKVVVENMRPRPPKKSTDQISRSESKGIFHSIAVRESKACKMVKNLQPLYPGKRFPSDIGRIYCYSLLDNNSGKQNDIYHIWYMDGNLKSKVRIRIRNGQEIPAVSHRDVNNSDKGTWKIEVTDSDKKILDTVIFEVV